MIKVTAIGLGTNYNQIPTGDIDNTLEAFVKSNALTPDIGNVYRAEWGNGEGADVFIIEAIPDTKKQLNVRLPAYTLFQLETIQAQRDMTQVQVLILAIEQLYSEKIISK